jgi:response regulator RpfG family c-di-GMP phosphodiesterase
MIEDSRPKVLFVDDEPDLLAALSRGLRSEQFGMLTAPSGTAALDMVRTQGPFAVIVSDLRMPGIDGVALLRRARELSPDTVRVLFTGQLDLEKAIAAVNEGEIFRFVVKPCPQIRLALVIKAALEQYRLITAERVLLEKTLHGSVRALTEILGLASPVAFGRATRLREAVAGLCATLGVTERWPIEVAAMFSQVGYVILPQVTIEKICQGDVLTEAEELMLKRIPAIVEQLLGNIPRLEPVQEILRYVHLRFDGKGHSSGTCGDAIPFGARALKAAIDLDTLENSGIETSLAIDTLRGREGCYDPAILEALSASRRTARRFEVRELPISALRSGMVLAQNVQTARGVLFLARGQEVTESLLEKLKNVPRGLLEGGTIRVVLHDVAA